MDERTKPSEIVITDVKIPMRSLIVLLVTLAIAAISAAIIIAILYFVAAGIFLGILTSSHH
jgi:hypothetical protein